MERTNVSCDFGKEKGLGGGDKEKNVEIAS